MVPYMLFYRKNSVDSLEQEYGWIMPVDDRREELEWYEWTATLLGVGHFTVMANFSMENEHAREEFSYEDRDERFQLLQTERGRKNFFVHSGAWVDPRGRLITGSYDIRPFADHASSSSFCSYSEVLYCDIDALRSVKSPCPEGISHNLSGDRMYVLDTLLRKIEVYVYNSRGQTRDNVDHIDLDNEIELEADLEPRGMVTDENGHLWVAASSKEAGKIIEINPDTHAKISDIDAGTGNIYDIDFGGENLEYLYILTRTDLLRVADIGVSGRELPDFLLLE